MTVRLFVLAAAAGSCARAPAPPASGGESAGAATTASACDCPGTITGAALVPFDTIPIGVRLTEKPPPGPDARIVTHTPGDWERAWRFVVGTAAPPVDFRSEVALLVATRVYGSATSGIAIDSIYKPAGENVLYAVVREFQTCMRADVASRGIAAVRVRRVPASITFLERPMADRCPVK